MSCLFFSLNRKLSKSRGYRNVLLPAYSRERCSASISERKNESIHDKRRCISYAGSMGEAARVQQGVASVILGGTVVDGRAGAVFVALRTWLQSFLFSAGVRLSSRVSQSQGS